MPKEDLQKYKEYWDGPKVGFNEELYKKYLRKKEAYRKKKREQLMKSINLN